MHGGAQCGLSAKQGTLAIWPNGEPNLAILRRDCACRSVGALDISTSSASRRRVLLMQPFSNPMLPREEPKSGDRYISLLKKAVPYGFVVAHGSSSVLIPLSPPNKWWNLEGFQWQPRTLTRLKGSGRDTLHPMSALVSTFPPPSGLMTSRFRVWEERARRARAYKRKAQHALM